MKRVLIILLGVLLCACTKTPAPSQLPTAASKPSSVAAETAGPKSEGGLDVGQASGSYTAKGESVELRYAYAGRGQRFGNNSTFILLTDQPIGADAVAEEIKSQTLLSAGKI